MTTSTPANRQATIDRALHLLNAIDRDTLCVYLAQTSLDESFQDDPDRLRSALEAGLKADLYAPYKAAQQLLRAAGQAT